MSANFQLLRFPRRKTFENYYASKFPFVLFVLRRLRVQEDEIENLAEEVFFAFFKDGSKVAPRNVNAWLATTARHFAFVCFRKRRWTPAKRFTRA